MLLPMARGMNRTGDYFFTGSTLAGDQDRASFRCHQLDDLADLLDCRALTDDILTPVDVVQFWIGHGNRFISLLVVAMARMTSAKNFLTDKPCFSWIEY